MGYIDNDLFRSPHRLMTKDQKSREEEIIAMIQSELNKRSNELDGYVVSLFGSRAAGTARPRSDFDIGLIGPEPITPKTLL